MLFWISWYQPTDDYRPIHFPPKNESTLGWWKTGDRSDGASTLVAYVVADSQEQAEQFIQIDWPEADEWRFCEQRNTIKPSDRFPLTLDSGTTHPTNLDWITQRISKFQQNN